MDTVAECGGKKRSPRVSTKFSLSMEMSRLTRDGTAGPVSRDQILRRERGWGKLFALFKITSSVGNLSRFGAHFAERDHHTPQTRKL